MGGLLQKLGMKVVGTVFAVIACLIYWNFTDGGGDYNEVNEMPAAVFDGGGGELAIDVNLSQDGELLASFSYEDYELEEYEELDVRLPLPAGQHHFTVDVAPDTYTYLQLDIDEPDVGAKIAWDIAIDGRQVTTEKDELTRPLDDGYAFFIQFEFDSIAEARAWAD